LKRSFKFLNVLRVSAVLQLNFFYFSGISCSTNIYIVTDFSRPPLSPESWSTNHPTTWKSVPKDWRIFLNVFSL